jgi:hypothetical protein
VENSTRGGDDWLNALTDAIFLPFFLVLLRFFFFSGKGVIIRNYISGGREVQARVILTRFLGRAKLMNSIPFVLFTVVVVGFTLLNDTTVNIGRSRTA